MGGSDGPTPTEEDRAKEFREITSRKDSIRMSPWKINLLTRQVRSCCYIVECVPCLGMGSCVLMSTATLADLGSLSLIGAHVTPPPARRVPLADIAS